MNERLRTQPFIFITWLLSSQVSHNRKAISQLCAVQHNIKKLAKRMMKHRSACANRHEDLVQWFPPLDHQASMNA